MAMLNNQRVFFTQICTWQVNMWHSPGRVYWIHWRTRKQHSSSSNNPFYGGGQSEKTSRKTSHDPHFWAAGSYYNPIHPQISPKPTRSVSPNIPKTYHNCSHESSNMVNSMVNSHLCRRCGPTSWQSISSTPQRRPAHISPRPQKTAVDVVFHWGGWIRNQNL